MTHAPKRINFEDIREGDTIRVVDVLDTKVAERTARELWAGPHSVTRVLKTRPNWPTSERKFQLLDRAVEPLPEKVGAAIRFDGQVWFLGAVAYAEGTYWHNTHTGEILSEGGMDARVCNSDVRNGSGFEVVN